MELEAVDVTIIGGGPVGLYGLYSAGLHGLSARLIERLPRLGGQLESLYPEKLIFDVAGYPAITAQALVETLKQQALQYSADVRLGEELRGLEVDDSGVTLTTSREQYRSRAVVITAGIGEFRPRRLGHEAIDRYEGYGVHYLVNRLQVFAGKDVVIVGGGNSAADWALNLAGRCKSITVVHRRENFQCHFDSAKKLQEGPFQLATYKELKEVGATEGHVSAAKLVDVRTGEETWVKAQEIIVAIGLIPDLGPLKQLGLTLEGNEIRVATTGETNLPRVYAAGDIVTYPGKIKLIATGFGEVATAVYGAVRWLDQEHG